MPGDRRQNRSKGRRHDSNSRRSSLVWTSDDTWSDNNIAQTAADRRNKPRHDRPPSRSPSPSSGSSLEIRVDRRAQRRRNAMRRHPSSGQQHMFTHLEDRAIRKSLRQKLLTNNAARLGKIERCILHAYNRSDGRASVTALEDAIAADAKTADTTGRGERVRRNELLWLMEKLKDRNGRHVAVCRIRAVLEGGERGGRRNDGGERMQRHLERRQRRDPFRSRSRGGEVDGCDSSADSGREEMTDRSTNESGVGRAGGTRGRPAYPARWAIRRGTVGQWLQDVSSPMEKRLFFEFIKGLEVFEHRNGLDHYRVRSEAHSSIVGTGSRDDGSTILHLGPMLKAAIRFYV